MISTKFDIHKPMPSSDIEGGKRAEQCYENGGCWHEAMGIVAGIGQRGGPAPLVACNCSCSGRET